MASELLPHIPTPTPRPAVSTHGPGTVSPGRPSTNLGHPLGSSQLKAAVGLHPSISLTSPLPFNIINPQGGQLPDQHQNYGSRVSNAIQSLTKPNVGARGAIHPSSGLHVVNWGQRVSDAVRSIVRSPIPGPWQGGPPTR